jgi:hypothetical protein
MKRESLMYFLVAMILFITSCKNNSNEMNVKNINDIVSEMKEVKISNNDNAVYADIQYNVKTGEILTYKIAERELDIVWIPTLSEKVLKTRGNSYKITCSVAAYKDSDGKPSKETTCDGAYGCGNKMKACLDAGGCATICKALIIRVPEIENVRDEELIVAVSE